MVNVDEIPLSVAVSRDGATVFATSTGRGPQTVTAIDTVRAEARSRVERAALYAGLEVAPDGRTLYAAGGGTSTIEVLDWDGNALTSRASYPTRLRFPAGLALSPDGALVYAVNQAGRGLEILATADGAHVGSIGTGNNPFDVALSPAGDEAYVSAERDSTVEIFDVRDPAGPVRLATLDVPKNPEGLAVSADGTRLWVANADEDTVTSIDLGERKVERSIDLRALGAEGYGRGPNALAFSPDGTRLYVAQATENAIAVVDLATSRVIGAIPTAWYPTAVAVSPDGKRLYVANAKGTGAGPTGPVHAQLRNGATVQLLDIPSDSELAELATRIDAMNARSANLFDVDARRFSNPVPRERGGESPIEHLLIVVRENKTYDALLGDWAAGDGVAENCLYCGEVTPNLHALVERFASGDNYYSNAEISDQGHQILTGAISNTYMEKNRFAERRPGPFFIEVVANPATYPKKQYLFQNLIDHGIRFRNYGEAVGMFPRGMILDTSLMNWSAVDPPFFYPLSKDVDKLESRIAEWERDGLPRVAFMLFPDDHTLGCSPVFPTPRSMVADNDLATGRLVDWLSHSKYWESSLVLVVEDDPQDGVDHIDAHRSILLAASPWVRRGYVSPVLYHEGNWHATIEYLLGLPPLTTYDERAQPMWDLFTDHPDTTPFTALPRQVPEERGVPGTECADATANMRFLDPDEAEGLQAMLWAHEQIARAGGAALDPAAGQRAFDDYVERTRDGADALRQNPAESESAP